MKIGLCFKNHITFSKEYTSIDLSVIERLAEIPDNSCEEILANNIFDYIGIDMLKPVLSKLSFDGIIIIQSLDILTIAKAVLSQNISVQQCSQLLYSNKQYIFSFEDIIIALTQNNLQIITKQLKNMEYTIVAKRPVPIVN